jgi:SAM-dependent methyltransferase
MKPGIVVVFCFTSFLAAWLLFTVEPMIGKMVLPIFGGTPSVWNTCLVFYQTILLAGYVLASMLASGGAGEATPTGSSGASPSRDRERLRVRFALALGVLILLLGYLAGPISITSDERAAVDAGPVLTLLGILSRRAALPLIAVATTAPLVQQWFARTSHPRAGDPYFLYAASNFGSLLALVAYPFGIEPYLGLEKQSEYWRIGFGALAILILACFFMTRRLRLAVSGLDVEVPGTDTDLPRVSTHFRWLLLVFIPSSWLMGVTSYLTTDLAAIPLFWTIPLALYLISFIVAFSPSAGWVVTAASRMLPWLVLPMVLVSSAGFAHAAWIPLHLAAFFAGSVACHGALARLRPAARHAGDFYIQIALGGLLGGTFNALVAPLIFDRVLEYPLAIVLSCLVEPLMAPSPPTFTRRSVRSDLIIACLIFFLTALLTTNVIGVSESAVGVAVVMTASGLAFQACVRARGRPLRFALSMLAVLAASGLNSNVNGRLLHIERNFFGVVRVTHDPVQNVNRLFHGSTLHGQQSLDPARRREPLAYFTRSGPIGQVFEDVRPRWRQPDANIAIVGLGAGTLAAYAEPGEHWSFYEIDSAVVRIANDHRYFHYLEDCRTSKVLTVLGDARLRIAEAPAHSFSLIVLDAFSSDAVPVHLVSREAIALYRDKLRPGGMLVFNLSNRYLDLAPIMARQADDAGLLCRVRLDLEASEDDKRGGKQPSIWAVMTANLADLGPLAADSRWSRPEPRARARVWTDDYSDMASYVLFKPRPVVSRGQGMP